MYRRKVVAAAIACAFIFFERRQSGKESCLEQEQHARKKRRGQMNYREKYKQHYGIDFGPEYEVHHLDLNHQNDDIENLLLLPKEIHIEYHRALFALTPFDSFEFNKGIIKFDPTIRGLDEPCATVDMQKINTFISVYKSCQPWMDYKHYLDGRISNIHGIQLGGAV